MTFDVGFYIIMKDVSIVYFILFWVQEMDYLYYNAINFMFVVCIEYPLTFKV
jgi:hypothetical protein